MQAITAGIFALIKQTVHPLDTGCDGIFSPHQGGSQGDGHRQVLVVPRHRRVSYETAEALPDYLEFVELADMAEHTKKFFPAPAAHQVEGAAIFGQGGGHHFENLVPCLMAVGIVDQLEMVNVRKNQAEGPAVALELIEPGLQKNFQIRAVGDAGEGIEVGQTFQFLDPMERGDLFGVVAENLYCAQDAAVMVPERRHPHGNRQAVSVLVMQIYRGSPGLAVLDGLGQGTGAQAEGDALIVHMLEEILETFLAQDFLAAVTGDGFRRLVPEGDAPLAIDVINPS